MYMKIRGKQESLVQIQTTLGKNRDSELLEGGKCVGNATNRAILISRRVRQTERQYGVVVKSSDLRSSPDATTHDMHIMSI